MPNRLWAQRSWIGLGALSSGAALVAVTVFALAPTRAAAGGNFGGVASAAGVRLTVTAQNAPATSTPVDGGGPVAQAKLDSLGTSEAFASFPYPGDVAVSLPGTLAGLTKGQVNLPAYPFYASSTFPLHPTGAIHQGPYSLSARSQSQSSHADATAGLLTGPGTATTATTSDVTQSGDGAVVASAMSNTTGLSLGPLTIGSLTGDASVMLKPDGTLTRTSHLAATAFSVGRMALALTDQGVTIPGGNAPLPSLAAVNAILAPAQIQLHYLAARSTPSGVISAGLQITRAETFPDVGPTTVTYTFGLDSAAINGVTAAPADTGPPLASTPPATPLTGGGAAAPASVASSAPAGGPVSAPAPVLAPTVRGHPPARVLRPRLVSRAGLFSAFSVFRFYSILFGAGLMTAGLALVVSVLGVRVRWNF